MAEDNEFIGSQELARLLGVTRTTIYNYLNSDNPMIPQPASGGKGKPGEKLRWLRTDVAAHLEMLACDSAFVGVKRSAHGWVPTVAFRGRRWDGQIQENPQDAFKSALEHYESKSLPKG